MTLTASAVSVGLLMTSLGCPDVRQPATGAPDAPVPVMDAQAGAAHLVVPPAGMAGPTNLARVVVAADADPGMLTLEGAHVAATPACEAAWCGELALDGPLLAGRTYFVRAGSQSLPLVIGSAPDHAPPQLVVDSITAEGTCAAVRLYSDEPVTVELRDDAGHSIARRDVAALSHEVVARAPHGPQLVALVADLAGNSSAARIDWEPVVELPPLALTEVMAHPLGAQPAQEWIEVKNRSSQTISTAGLVVAAAGGSDPLPAALIPPGGFAVIAGAGFVPDDGQDVPPAPGALLLRLASPTIGSGLSNAAGVAVELRDASGHVISRYGGWIDTSPRSAAGKSAARTDAAACDARASWQRTAHPTPGAPNVF